jgi:DNA polymerase I-like protein with 3'-5' exonuclease and polymerase domains/uracil-DNA glycosylase
MAKLTIGPSGPVNARIMIVGDVPNEQDLRRGEPFIGGGGFEMTKMLQEAGIRREDCYLTTVFKSRVFPGTLHIVEKKKDRLPEHVLFQGQYITRDLFNACMDLLHEIDKVKPNVICTVGNLALFALTGETSSYNYRSSIMDSVLLQGYKVIPTLNVDAIHAQWAKRNWMVHDFKRVKRNSETPGLFIRDYSRLIAENNSDEQFQRIVANLEWLAESFLSEPNTPLACDIETRGGHITCISFAWAPTQGICIQLSPLHNAEGFWHIDHETALVWLICKILMHPNVLLVGQNFNYDLQYIHRHWGILPSNVADTMLMQHSAFSNLPKNLGFLSSMYCEDHLYWKDDRTDWKDGDDGENEMKYWEYCTTDSCRTLAIYHVLKSVLKAMNMEEVNAFQQRLRPKVLKSMIRGVRVDQQKRSDLSMKLMQEMETRSQWMREVVGYDLNIRSPKQMQDFFYRQMGIRPVRSQTGGITTADAALHTIANREPILWPIVRKVQEMRSLGVFHSTFVMAPLDNDRRMRCSFNIAGTETYRFSSSKNAFGTGMNMQNIPKGGETESEGLELPNIRELFIPDEGQCFFDIDLDSADLRIVTWESDCLWMKDHFKNGRKPYVEVMREYYHDNTMSKNSHPREYAMFKSLCHGTNYLGTAEGIAPRIGLLVRETERIQAWYFGMCPEIKRWQDHIKQQVSGRRYVENAFGYRNYFFDKIEGTVFNQAIAWIPQSSVACLINRAYLAIDDNHGDWISVLLQVHDSLAGTFSIERRDEALKAIQECATIAIPYEDPLFIPVGVVSSTESWGACE